MFTLLILVLATYEVTDWLVYQEGPYNIFGKIRNYFGVLDIGIDDDKKHILSFINRENYNLVGHILECPYCTKVWVALFLTIFVFININILLPIAVMGAITVILDLKEG